LQISSKTIIPSEKEAKQHKLNSTSAIDNPSHFYTQRVHEMNQNNLPSPPSRQNSPQTAKSSPQIHPIPLGGSRIAGFVKFFNSLKGL
jgi:hypothetical protein